MGPQPRTGYPNPTIVELDVGMLNAIGLPNPGIEEFRDEVKVALDGGAVVIGSVFGKDADEYAIVAKRLASYGAVGIELNLSCPHAKGLGMEIAQSTEAVREFTAAVKGKVTVPVFPKLSPNVSNIAAFAQAAEDGGADAIVAINTLKAMAISPELKMPILSYRYGGVGGPRRDRDRHGARDARSLRVRGRGLGIAGLPRGAPGQIDHGPRGGGPWLGSRSSRSSMSCGRSTTPSRTGSLLASRPDRGSSSWSGFPGTMSCQWLFPTSER